MWVLVSLQDPDVKHVLVCGRDYIVGRKDCDIQVQNDAAVSRKHAKLHAAHSEANLAHPENLPTLTIEDLSKFGSWVNKERLQGQKIIQDGDELVFGSQKSVYTVVYEPFIVTSSCLDNTAKRKVRQSLCQIGGHLVTEWRKDCCLLVMNSVSVTIKETSSGFSLDNVDADGLKVVCAMLAQKAIVSPGYLEAYVNFLQGNVDSTPDPKSFLPHISESQVDPAEVSFAVDPQRKTLFQGKTFIFLQQKQFRKMALAVEIGGGTPLLMEDKPGRGEEGILTEPGSLVMSCPPDKSMPAGWQEWHRYVEKTLARHKKHMIQDAELGFAVLYCSTENHCNPDKKFCGGAAARHLPSQSLSQAPDFSSLDDSVPVGRKAIKQEKTTPPNTPAKRTNQSKVSDTNVKPDTAAVRLKHEDRSPSPVQRSQKGRACKRSPSPIPIKETKPEIKNTSPVKFETETGKSESNTQSRSQSAGRKTPRNTEQEASTSSETKPRTKREHDMSRSPSPAPKTRSRSPSTNTKQKALPSSATKPSRSRTHELSRSPSTSKTGLQSQSTPRARSGSPSPAPKTKQSPSTPRTRSRSPSPAPKTRLGFPSPPRTRSRSPSPASKTSPNVKGKQKVKVEMKSDECVESDIVETVKNKTQKKLESDKVLKISKRNVIDEDSDDEFGFNRKPRKKIISEDSDDDFGSVRSKKSKFSDSTGSATKGKIKPRTELSEDGSDYDDFGPIRNSKRKRMEENKKESVGFLREEKRNKYDSDATEEKSRKQRSKMTSSERVDVTIIDSEDECDSTRHSRPSPSGVSKNLSKRIKSEIDMEHHSPADNLDDNQNNTTEKEGANRKRKGDGMSRRVMEREVIDEERPEPPDGFLTTRGRIRQSEAVGSVKQEVGADEEVPSNLMVTVFMDLIHRPVRGPVADGDAPPQGFAKWKNKTVRNFKKFKKIQHGGANRLPNIIGGSDLVPHIGTQRKEIEDWFREAQQMESQHTEAEREATELFEWQPHVGTGKKSRR